MNGPDLPPHVEETVRAVEKLHIQHRKSASPMDRLLERLKGELGRPAFLGWLLALVAAWILGNITLPARFRPDPAPFLYLALVLAIGAVCLTVLILATQYRADQLADHREKLILQLTFISEQKTAKLIALVEELRRDLPHVRDREDTQAEQMTESLDVTTISKASSDSPELHEA